MAMRSWSTVDSPAWASHLKTLAPDLLGKLSAVAGEGAPSSLVIRVRAAAGDPSATRDHSFGTHLACTGSDQGSQASERAGQTSE